MKTAEDKIHSGESDIDAYRRNICQSRVNIILCTYHSLSNSILRNNRPLLVTPRYYSPPLITLPPSPPYLFAPPPLYPPPPPLSFHPSPSILLLPPPLSFHPSLLLSSILLLRPLLIFSPLSPATLYPPPPLSFRPSLLHPLPLLSSDMVGSEPRHPILS